MKLFFKKFTATLFAFLMIISIGNGVMHPLAESQTSTSGISSDFSTASSSATDSNVVSSPKNNLRASLQNGDITVDERTFPDAKFRQFVKDTYCGGGTTLTQATIDQTKNMNCNSERIASLRGIEYFTALTSLNCSQNRLVELNVSSNDALNELDCSLNEKLDCLDVNSGLKELDCSWDSLDNLSIDIIAQNGSKLTKLICHHNKLEYINIPENSKLEELDCSFNKLHSCGIEGDNQTLKKLSCNNNLLSHVHFNLNLEELNCSTNNLEDLSNLADDENLLQLDCSSNMLSSLDLSKNTKLEKLYCFCNPLSNLDFSNANIADLKELDCSYDDLSNIDVRKFTKLTNLNCSNNNLNELNIYNNTELEYLNCSNNQLTSLSIDNNSKLNMLNVTGNLLTSLDNNKLNKFNYINCENQKSETVCYVDNDGKYKVNIGAILTNTDPNANSRVSIASGHENEWEYNPDTGIATCKSENFINNLVYNYGIDPNHSLTVNLSLNRTSPYKVTFDSNGGSAVPYQIIPESEKAQKPITDPTKEGYIFDGWYNGAQLFDFRNLIQSDITLTAHWTKSNELQPGIYKISSALNANYVLDVNNGSTDDTANIQLYQSNDTSAQRFDIEKVGDYYTIKCMCSDKMFDVANAGKDQGTNLWQYSANGTDAQLWKIEDQGDGTWKFVSKCNGLCINVSGGETQNGQNIWLWPEDQTKANKFLLTKDANS